MGNRWRPKHKLFNSKDFLYELSDYLLVFELAAQNQALGSDDPGRSLKALNAALANIFDEYQEQFGEPAEIELKHLYPVAKHLCVPKSKSDRQFTPWLQHDKKTGAYTIHKDASKKDIRLEMRKMATALECAHRRLRHLIGRL